MVKALQPVDLHQYSQIQRSVDFINILGLDVQFLLNDLQQPLIHAAFHFQADGFAPLTLL